MLGILYDIHGNLDALNAVLADADETRADRWLLGGDYGTPSPYPLETLARLRELPNATWIRGNGERWLLEPPEDATPAHRDPDPVRRVARRIVQRLDGMGKWGGYHTEFVHLARGFAGHERALALEVGERLLAAGLLAEKTSVGQRHVFLNPRRSGEIRAFIAQGTLPPGLELPRA